MAGKPPVMRIKAKRKDGTELPTTDREGRKVRMARVELGVVWENDGKQTLKFTHPAVAEAVSKALGGECYYDVYQNDGPKGGGSKGRASEDEQEDDDF